MSNNLAKMIGYYLKIAFRNLARFKTPALISTIGLGVGLFCFVICSYCGRLIHNIDKEFPGSERFVFARTINENGITSLPASLLIENTLQNIWGDDVAFFTYVSPSFGANMKIEAGHEGGYVTESLSTIEIDSNFKHMFSVKLLTGNWEQAVKQENAVLLTRSSAERIFGDQSPLGKKIIPNEILLYHNLSRQATQESPEDYYPEPYVICGVIEDLPLNAGFRYMLPLDALLLNDGKGILKNSRELADRELSLRGSVYGLLYPDKTIRQVNESIDPQKYRKQFGDFSPVLIATGNLAPYYQGLDYFLSGVAWVILLASTFNFLLFTGGNLLNRLKEYEIRKIVGSSFGNICGQITMEYLILLVLSFLSAAILTGIFLNSGIPDINFYFQSAPVYRLLVYTLIVGTGICTCLALVLTYFVRNEEMHKRIRFKGIYIRNVFLLVQLVICIFFFSTGTIGYLQLQKMKKVIWESLSPEEKDHILQIDIDYAEYKGVEEILKKRFVALPEVKDILLTDGPCLIYPGHYNAWDIPGHRESYRFFYNLKVSDNFNSFMNISLLEGASFHYPDEVLITSGSRGHDQVGSKIYSYDTNGKIKTDIIKGVIPDITITLDKNEYDVDGIIISPYDNFNCFYLKIYNGHLKQARKKVESILHEFYPMSVETMSEAIKSKNHRIILMYPLLFSLGIITLLVALLGIYSAISLDTRCRQKEVAIRKINGASHIHIIGVFIKTYLFLLGMAFMITIPVVWWITDYFLNRYTTRFEHTVSFWILIMIMILFFVVLALTGKLIRVIRENPACVLKNN